VNYKFFSLAGMPPTLLQTHSENLLHVGRSQIGEAVEDAFCATGLTSHCREVLVIDAEV
jgi:hypothetical protein